MLGRLRKTEEFERVRAVGLRRRGKFCILNAALSANTNGALTRVGYITSKKVGGAVQRNRARRLLREAMRHLVGQISTSWDIVLIAQTPLTHPSTKMPQVQDELTWLLKQAAILSPNPNPSATASATVPTPATPSSGNRSSKLLPDAAPSGE